MKRRLIKCSLENVVVSDSLRVDKLIGGSASYILNSDLLPVKFIDSDNKSRVSRNRIKVVVLVDFDIYGTGEILSLLPSDYEIYSNLGYVRKVDQMYKLNKNKVRSKILAYSKLRKSQIFMAFYSISFPRGLSDEVIRRIHNTVLTRIRKLDKLFSYIWIAERQKNGTLHFHMLTNRYFNIRIINYMYARAIHNQIIKLSLNEFNYDYKKYNGVDVKMVSSIDSLSKYLTKYVTKNNELYDGLCWNCDSSVSALVTHIYLNDNEFKELSKKLIYVCSFNKSDVKNDVNIDFDIYNYGSYRPKIIFSNIPFINQYIVSDYYRRKGLVYK